MNLYTFLQNLINGLSLGSLYALIAIGYTMVYGILRLINFAHGDVFMMAVYFAFFLVTLGKVPWLISFVIAILAAALLGFTIDRVAYKPIRNAPRVSALITAIGVSFFLESFAVVVFSGIPRSFRNIYPKFLNNMLILGGHEEVKYGRNVIVGGLRIPIVSFVILIVTAIALVILWWIIYKTKIGMAMRAVSVDIPTTSLMGVNVDGVIGFTFALGSALAAIGGLLWATRYPQLWPYMGFMPGLKAFIAAVFGGIGSIQGAVVGGFLLGLTEIMLVGFFPKMAGYRDAFAFLILILILSVKPEGLLGKRSVVKV
ncbi:MAG: branched-chain amino acid ABC transporter permease [Thermotogae bacterium]|uniref:branched-chain amino acid ABC transporter permease n=1 Tax=Kosmotoga sp. TaxID=1955248 RepID=UPI000F2125E7|nr:branched-chain amino acid ABC transporter permease [Kosmotoga sp.]RKX47672.1 MAG: branched-chain amino acid ABC transporter permease [Thermotogota bacterium]